MKKVSILGIIALSALSALTLSACSANKDDSKPTKPKTEHKEDKKSKTKKESKKNDTSKKDNSKISTPDSNKATVDNNNKTSNKNSIKQASNSNGYVPNTATKENTANMSNYDRYLANRYHYDVLTGKQYGTPEEQVQGRELEKQDQDAVNNTQNDSDSAKFYDETNGTYHAPGSNPDGTPDAWVQDQIDSNNSNPEQELTNDNDSQATTNDDTSDN